MTGKVMGIDLGKARIGIAVSDGLRLCANPAAVIASRGMEEDAAEIARLAEESEAVEFVVGLPLHMNSTESEGSQKARAFAERLGALTGKPVTLWDERLSTVEALETMTRASVRRGKRKKMVDKVAATLILQSFLDAKGE